MPSREVKARYDRFSRAMVKAKLAGLAAGKAAVPETMVVVETRSAQRWEVPEGPCGFAWVSHHPGGDSFSRWARKHEWDSAYGGGIQLWISEFGQSVTRKYACARAMAEVLREELGLEFFAMDRLD